MCWDVLCVSRGQLVAAIDFRSEVGPWFGDGFNHHVETALGKATDLNTAFREDQFGESSKPFVGYFFVLEECPQSTTRVKFVSPNFPARRDFENTSYAQRYETFCRKLVLEQLYDGAALVLTEKSDAISGTSRSASELTSVRRFASTLAGKVVAVAAEADQTIV
jgi:hypothetical protein